MPDPLPQSVLICSEHPGNWIVLGEGDSGPGTGGGRETCFSHFACVVLFAFAVFLFLLEYSIKF